LAVDHHVRRLQVAVEDAALVRGGNPRADLPRDFDRLVLGEAADAAEQRREILAVDVLHREERGAVGVADVVGPADVAMRDGARDAHFVVELRQASGMAGEILGQQLQRDGLSELQVVGAVHLAHAALAERRDDAEAAGENGSGFEAFTGDAAGDGG
jgi:hypothetical protein